MEKLFRTKIDLSGLWDFNLPGGKAEKRRVPGSYHMVGVSEYRRRFRVEKPRDDQRVLLCFEGVNYDGTVFVNGENVGKTFPYCHEQFDVTDLLKDENEILVRVQDIGAPYGITDGWCAYSGIIRAVYLLVVPAVRLTDVYWRQNVADDLKSVSVKIEVGVSTDLSDSYSFLAELTLDGKTFTYESKEDPEFVFPEPKLWSPACPTLYNGKFYLLKNGEVVDCVEQKIGFRRITKDDKRFFVNNEPFFFVGVCRHDLGSDEEGFTLSDEAIERDLTMIKALGANFVRLVHYPHDKRVIDACDRLGLFVSEESGLWWSDMHNKTLTDGALHVLEKTVVRDRSNACVAFWMSFNECVFTQEYLIDAAKACRALDNDRFVAGANCMCPEMTTTMFDGADLDFYTYHPYGMDPTNVSAGTLNKERGHCQLTDIFNDFTGKPLIFTEWGGWNVTDNSALFLRFCDRMRRAKNDGQLAGMIYWAFADMYEFNRGNNACYGGVQIEGLVKIDRTPKVNYYNYQRFISEINRVDMPERNVKFAYEGTDGLDSEAIVLEKDFVTQKAAFDAATEQFRTAPGGFAHRRQRFVKKGPRLPENYAVVGSLNFNAHKEPLVLSDKQPKITAKVDAAGKILHVLGASLYGHGFPQDGVYGEICAKVTLAYNDGSEKTLPLRNGIELLSVDRTYGSSMIDPRSASLKTAIDFTYDGNFENYRCYMLDIALEDKVLSDVRFESVSTDRPVLIYGLSLEK